jgi:hypothetical protein
MRGLTMATEALVTICKPGKRAGLTYRPPAVSRFPVVTIVATREAKSERQVAAELLRGAAEERDVKSVALASRAAHGFTDPLGRFVAAQRLRGELDAAGLTYAEIVRDARIAMGLAVPGQPKGPGKNSGLDEDELMARKELALMRRDGADRVLFNRQRIAAMIRLTYDEIYPPSSETRMLRQGLFALARHFGMIKLGINEEKAY